MVGSPSSPVWNRKNSHSGPTWKVYPFSFASVTVCRRIAIDRRRGALREKRGGGEVPVALSELEECIASGDSVEAALNHNALRDAMNDFLETLSDEKRRIFIERYTFLMPPREIARRHAMTSASVRMALGRMRKALKQYLEEEGLL